MLKLAVGERNVATDLVVIIFFKVVLKNITATLCSKK